MHLFLVHLALAAPLEIPEIQTEEVRIDGVMDEAVWDLGAQVTEFLKFQPASGGPPAGSTEVRLFHDDRFLYMGVRVRDSEVPIRARISARERINADDQIGLYLDTFAEGGSGFVFYLNAIGIQQDMQVLPGNFNPSWNTVFKSRGRLVGTHGYDLELAMPFRSLKYPSGQGPQDWRMILTRKIPGLGYKYGWPELERNVPRVFTQGHPVLIDPPDAGSGLELRGELAVVQTAARDDATDKMAWDPFGPRTVRPGIDVKYGITPNIGLGATLNPDFSQVENDETPINVNQRFAFYFSERRPFFLDGAGFFADRTSTLYSRSIVNPVYGAKLTGREGRVATGILHALDRSPTPSVHEFETPGFSAEDAEGALASNSVGRVAFDILDGGHVGVTLADKRLFGSDGLRGTHQNVQTQVYTPIGERWVFGGSSSHSMTGDPDGESLYGHFGEVGLSRSAAQGLGTDVWVRSSTPGHRQETGFRTQSGYVSGGGKVGWTFEPSGAIDTLTPSIRARSWEDDTGDSVRSAELELKTTIGGLYQFEAEAGVSQFEEDEVAVDGRWISLQSEGTPTSWLTWDGSAELGRTIDWLTLDSAQRVEATLETTFRPTAGLRLDTAIRHDRLDPSADEVRWASSVRTRATWQFTQQLGLRLIGQHVVRSSDDPLLTTSVLFTWLQHPGTALYLGYAETTAFRDRVEPSQRTVFAKGTVLLRI